MKKLMLLVLCAALSFVLFACATTNGGAAQAAVEYTEVTEYDNYEAAE